MQLNHKFELVLYQFKATIFFNTWKSYKTRLLNETTARNVKKNYTVVVMI